MRIWFFIFGLIVGIPIGMWAIGEIGRRVANGIDETYFADEMDLLRGESELLRIVALDQVQGLSAKEAEDLLRRLGVFAFAKSDEKLVARFEGRPGEIALALTDGRVTAIHNYCWRIGLDCAQTGEN